MIAIKPGGIIEQGWRDLSKEALLNPSDAELEDLRRCFFAGAAHAFYFLMDLNSDGLEPTDEDVEAIARIGQEVSDFIDECLGDATTKGRA